MKFNEAIGFLENEKEFNDEKASTYLYSGSDEEASIHTEMAKKINGVIVLLKKQHAELNPQTPHLNILPSELEGLPEELKNQLSTDGFEQEILKIMEEYNGTISIDRLILAWYQRYEKVLERRNVTAKLYRMKTNKVIFPTGAKGVYSLKETDFDDEADFFNDSNNDED